MSAAAPAASDPVREFAHARVALRHYRLFSRAPYVDVSSNRLVLHLPAYFGAKQNLVVAIGGVAVADPTMSAAPSAGAPAAYVPPLRLPYLPTTSPNVNPNIMLLFATPQRIPPLRRRGAMSSGLGRRASRSPDGVLVDGVRLRAVAAREAIDTIAFAGAARVGDPDAWFAERRDTTSDPDVVAQVRSIMRRSRVSVVAGMVGLVLLVVGRWLLDHADAWWPAVIGGAGVVAAFGIPALISRRNRATQRSIEANAARRTPTS